MVEKKEIQRQEDLKMINRFYKEKKVSWLGLLLERYFHLIFGLCMRYLKNEREAKDHTQQICMEVIHAFQQKHQKITYFKAWLYQVTRNHCLMHLRKKTYQTVALDSSFEIAEKVLPDKQSFYKKEQQYQLLEEALTSLKKGQEKCIRLFYYEQKSYKEIVDETSYSLKEVKSFIQNGRRNIKIFMEKQKDE